MRRIVALFFLLAVLIPLWSKDLSGRFGLGADLLMVPTGQGPTSNQIILNSVSLRTYVNPQMGLGGSFGMTVNGETSVGLGANFFYVLASEANVNLLAKVGFNLGLDDDDVFSFPLLLDAEFFIDKMSNLGIDLAVGLVHLDIIGDDTFFYLGTSSLAPTLGFHYYF